MISLNDGTNLGIVVQLSISDRQPTVGQTCQNSYLNAYVNLMSGRHVGYI